MKNIKKILAMLMATAMVLSSGVVAFAEGETPAAATGNVSSDTTLTIQHLEQGDEVNLYKVMEWVDGTGWRVTSAFADLVRNESGNNNFSQAIKDIQDNKTGVTLSEEDVKKIEALAGSATIIDGDSETTGNQPFTVPASTTFTYGDSTTPADPGLYLAIVAPYKAGTLYNPIVLASDYSKTNNNETIDAEAANLIRGVAPDTIDVPKKETLIVTKVADDTSHDTGDTVTFTITTTVPLYSTSYTNPVFKVTDTLSDNLTLNADSIKVYKTADSTNKTELVDGTKVTKATTGITPSTADFQITFTSDYLKDMTAALPITIEYTATFTNDGGVNVEVEDNTVDIDYSNNPGNSDDYGKVKDETKHYTFTIDGSLLGNNEYTTSEIVKVGIDADGNEITQTTTLSNGNAIGALQGAKFALFTAQPAAGSTASESDAKADANIYKNTNYSGGCIVESDASGHITIAGLDADNNNGEGTTYYLAEVEAPSGYIKDSTVYAITIIPVFEDHTYTDATDTTLTWTVSELKSYQVKVGGVKTAEYTFTDSSNTAINTFDGAAGEKATAGDTVVGATGPIIKNDGENAATDPKEKKETTDADGKIQNTQGTALPSTGGVGTTMMYMFGAIFVMFAGVLLVSKRRMAAR